MFETPAHDDGAARLRGLLTDLAGLSRDVDDATRIDRIRALEDLKAACAAAQARDAADLDTSQRAQQAAAGVPAAERGRGVAAQVALARRDSPHRGARHLGLAKALVHEMPHTLAALSTGALNEWRATILVRETATLTREQRSSVDTQLAGDDAALGDLEQLGDRALAARARHLAYRLDPHTVVDRARHAQTERCVTIRPAPDTMAWLTALLPAREAISVHAALSRAAEHARSTGDPRSRGQLMADTLVTTVTTTLDGTGGTSAAAGAGPGDWASTWAQTPDQAAALAAVTRRPGPEDVALRVVITDRALLGRPSDPGHDEPAHLDGYGPVPAAWARDLISTTLDPATAGPAGTDATSPARVFVKRLLTDPVGAVTAMDSRARLAPTGLAAFIRTRDAGTCRTPWCDAPVRHSDHVTPHARGGPTTADQLQGLCEACNHVKQLLGWRARVVTTAPGDCTGRHTVETTTPTGHTYRSTAPLLPGVTVQAPDPDLQPDTDLQPPAAADDPPTQRSRVDADPASPVERWLRRRLDLAAA